MKHLLLIANLLFTSGLIAQSEFGTIRVIKSEYEEVMRENPKTSRRCCLLPSPCIRNYIIVGAGFNPQIFGELGFERELFHHKGSAGILLQVAKIEGIVLRLFGEAKLIYLKDSPFILAGLSGNLALNSNINNSIQPYIGLRVPKYKLSRFQLNAGYAINGNSKNENEVNHNLIILGLWCRL